MPIGRFILCSRIINKFVLVTGFNYSVIENALALMTISSEWIIVEEERRGRPRRAEWDPGQAPAALMPSARTWPC